MMDKPDFSEYERSAAELHEELCRLASTLVFIMQGFCRLRACRRRRACSGPMLPSPHQAFKIRVQKEIGLSGQACANLPLCIANREPPYYDAYRTTMEAVRKIQEDHPDEDLLALFRHTAAMQRFQRNLS